VSNQTSRLVCAGCGAAARPVVEDPYPFACRAARPGDDVDHVMHRTLDRSRLRFPEGNEWNPFLRYRSLLHSYHVSVGPDAGDDETYCGLVEQLDRAVAEVDGYGFVQTPFAPHRALGEQLGFATDADVWIKDETGNVSGSHKARHLMGIMLYLRVIEQLGLQPAAAPPLAIASCGNAALAAAVVARAAGRPLGVFVPPSADPLVVEELQLLGAQMTVCPRGEGVRGDPCYLRFRRFLQEGGLAFSCQGNTNGLTIEGGSTLGWEMIDQLEETTIDRLFVQVGGGALASACIQAFADARHLGRIERLPRIHAVQTRGGFPLKRAYDRLADRILARLGRSDRPAAGEDDEERADLIRQNALSSVIAEELAHARRHRSEFMWPWETEPRSIASGILDDETYDWAAGVEGMLRTGGYPIVVDEDALGEANRLARATTGINVDHTGSAGLAGLMDVARRRAEVRREKVAVIFSGVQRSKKPRSRDGDSRPSMTRRRPRAR